MTRDADAPGRLEEFPKTDAESLFHGDILVPTGPGGLRATPIHSAAVNTGETLLSPAATQLLVTRFLATPDHGSDGALPGLPAALTPREREVTALAANGRSNSEIAESLFLSPLTVRTHIQRAMNKLDARDRAQLVVFAYRSGLVRAEPPAAG